MATSIIKCDPYAVKKINYGTAEVLESGTFLLQFPATWTGWTPIAVISTDWTDRSLGGQVFITGVRILSGNAEILGKSTVRWSVKAEASVTVLYRKS